MTETIAIDPLEASRAPEPEYIEALLRNRSLKALYWTVGEPDRIDPEDPETGLVAELVVIYTNGRHFYSASATFDLGVIYGLVGNDEITRSTAEWAMDALLEGAWEITDDLSSYAEDERFAEAIDTWKHSDADLVLAAADKVEGEWGELLRMMADLVASIRLDQDFTLADPKVQMAAQAVKIAWELL